MSKTRPFTLTTIQQYPDFIALPVQERACICKLFESKQVNDTGNLTRPRNAFFIFRPARSAEILNEHQATHGSNLAQKDISAQIKQEWAAMSPQDKRVYELLAKAEAEDRRVRFPNYDYTPVPGAWWNALTRDGKRRFFFESLVRICKTMVYSDYRWPGYTSIQQWAQDPRNAAYVDQVKLRGVLASGDKPVATPRHASRGSGSPPTALARPHQAAPHPYNAARVARDQAVGTWLDKLKSELVYLGPRKSGDPERTLELLIPQPREVPESVYVEKEVPLGTPQDIVDITRIGIPPNALILHDYTMPRQILTTSPHPQSASPPLPNLSIPSAALTSPPSASSSTPSSGVTSNYSLITPVQPGLPSHNGVFIGGYWNQPSGDYREHMFPASPVAAGAAQLSPGCMPGKTPNPSTVSSAAYRADISLGIPYQPGLPTPLAGNQPRRSDNNNSAQAQVREQNSRTSAREPAQSAPQNEKVTLDSELAQLFNLKPMQPEELEQVDQCFDNFLLAQQGIPPRLFNRPMENDELFIC